ncbi:WG repeat-containing protein [Parasulfitobacter algicola]|uniref:WG repeat-containing protein n=1 Tax=Parasulfitobacter algicola TaxID=2614809 RepID=A0ABX2J0J9_9RHOB|nr:WG repeat-containing protein [Sulfitobacter algicola]NSX56288.1 WG repeat-containing protein [Sulfitobacter algicola]
MKKSVLFGTIAAVVIIIAITAFVIIQNRSKLTSGTYVIDSINTESVGPIDDPFAKSIYEQLVTDMEQAKGAFYAELDAGKQTVSMFRPDFDDPRTAVIDLENGTFSDGETTSSFVIRDDTTIELGVDLPFDLMVTMILRRTDPDSQLVSQIKDNIVSIRKATNAARQAQQDELRALLAAQPVQGIRMPFLVGQGSMILPISFQIQNTFFQPFQDFADTAQVITGSNSSATIVMRAYTGADAAAGIELTKTSLNIDPDQMIQTDDGSVLGRDVFGEYRYVTAKADDDGHLMIWVTAKTADDIQDAISIIDSYDPAELSEPDYNAMIDLSAAQQWRFNETELNAALTEILSEETNPTTFVSNELFRFTISTQMTTQNGQQKSAIGLQQEFVKSDVGTQLTPRTNETVLRQGDATLLLQQENGCITRSALPVSIPGIDAPFSIMLIYDGTKSDNAASMFDCAASYFAFEHFASQRQGLLTAPAIDPGFLDSFRQYDNAVRYGDANRIIVEKDEKEGVLSLTGELIIPILYEDIDIQEYGIKLTLGGKVGWANLSGTVLVEPEYSNAYMLIDSDRLLMLIDDDATLYDVRSERMIISNGYISFGMMPSGNGVIAGADTSKDAFDLSGTRLNTEDLRDIKHLGESGNFIVQQTDEQWKFVGPDFEPISDIRLARYWVHWTPKLILVTYPDDTKAYVNFDGIRITPPTMTPRYAPSDAGYITVVDNETKKYGLLDSQGNIVLPLEYKQIHVEGDGVVPVKKDLFFGLVDLNGTALTELEFQNLKPSVDNLVWARKRGYWGIINHSGETVSPFEYLDIGRFRQTSHHETRENIDVAIAQNDSGFGLVDRQGQVVIPLEYQGDIRSQFLELKDQDGQILEYPHDFRN